MGISNDDFFQGQVAIDAVDMHSGGSPMRIITGGLPEIYGATYRERLEYVKKKLDFIRVFLTNEPRGYTEMTVIMPVPPDKEVAELAVIFMASTTYLQMCGEATICTSRYAVDNGLVEYKEPETNFTLQTPCGLVTCHVACSNGRAGEVRFQSVPSYLHSPSTELVLSSGRRVKADGVFAGAFYIIGEQSEFGIDLHDFDYKKKMDIPADFEEAANNQISVDHPDKSIPPRICGSIIRDSSTNVSYHLVVIDKALVNRGFCGSASTARATLDYFTGRLKLGESRVYASIVTGQGVTATPIKACKCGMYDAIVIELRGKGYYTGKRSFTFEDDDPLKRGYLG